MLLIAADPPRFTMVAVNRAHAEAFRTTVEGLEGHGTFEVFPAEPDPITAAFINQIRSSFDRLLETGVADQMPVMPYAVVSEGGTALEERHWTAVNAPVFDADGRVSHIISNVRDVTAEVNERRAVEARNLLMLEVDHRARNALTVVQSMIRLTRAPSVEEFRDALAGRVDALARAQTSLAERRWEGGDLRTILCEELAAHAGADRLDVGGPRMLLSADQVQSASMIVHELATNACKYGALSAPGGRISATWRRLGDGAVAFTWQESGGPPAVAPQQEGFGSRLIRKLAEDLGGGLRLTWAPTGLRAEFLIRG
ncbi:PAS domain-containing sensor histidine kinase [Phenylobacterium sp. J367]|uniref:PAS domain-containing sensor histidine kinase n=1 Tax=Phenylobacterium sp. J367 TaxID=2898435 RepID=UPI0021512384|nr:PAS domain-containing sensor histidine kinase [Phenylobacterium sp. J367]MCR5878639.1 PAS domain-containing protein [Phenylobacterium sp. J367]